MTVTTQINIFYLNDVVDGDWIAKKKNIDRYLVTRRKNITWNLFPSKIKFNLVFFVMLFGLFFQNISDIVYHSNLLLIKLK